MWVRFARSLERPWQGPRLRLRILFTRLEQLGASCWRARHGKTCDAKLCGLRAATGGGDACAKEAEEAVGSRARQEEEEAGIYRYIPVFYHTGIYPPKYSGHHTLRHPALAPLPPKRELKTYHSGGAKGGQHSPELG